MFKLMKKDILGKLVFVVFGICGNCKVKHEPFLHRDCAIPPQPAIKRGVMRNTAASASSMTFYKSDKHRFSVV